MSNKVIRFAEPFFLKVLHLLDQTDPPDSQQFRRLQQDLKADLGEIERSVIGGQTNLTAGEWDVVKRVLVYWADEVLTFQLAGWKDYTLEQEFYSEQNRAWKFYVEAENAISTGNSEVLELFYLAVVLGFEGDIADAFKEELRREMPGGHQDPAKARVHWTKELQKDIRYDAPQVAPNEQPLQGDVHPPAPGPSFVQTAGLAGFLISLLILLIVVGWYIFDRFDRPPAEQVSAVITLISEQNHS